MFLKLDKCRALFKNWLLVAQDLWWDKKARKSICVNQALVYYVKIIFQLRSAPGRKDASSQDCGSLSCKDSGDKNAEQAFLWSNCLWKNCHWHGSPNKPNQTKPDIFHENLWQFCRGNTNVFTLNHLGKTFLMYLPSHGRSEREKRTNRTLYKRERFFLFHNFGKNEK